MIRYDKVTIGDCVYLEFVIGALVSDVLKMMMDIAINESKRVEALLNDVSVVFDGRKEK